MTQEQLLKLFEYDRKGFLKWKIQPHRRGDLKGARAGWTRPLPEPRRHIQIGKKLFYEHRLIFLFHKGFLPRAIDHINGNPIDNRIENLRAATASENQCNRGKPSNNKSGVKGVHWDKKTQTWVATITFKYKRKTLGRFKSLSDAKTTREKAELKIHKNFMRQEGALFL